MPWHQRVTPHLCATLILALFGLLALTLYAFGHVAICECGYVKLWHGVTMSSENSQHISDWYTFSHIIHGFAFYWLAWVFFRKWPVPLRLLLAVGVEVGWEIFENTDYVINRYREATVSLDYYGDSIINSVADTAFMVLGFLAARRAPVIVTLLLILLFEIGVGYAIRDNLALNIIMLVHPSEAILEWQSNGSLQ